MGKTAGKDKGKKKKKTASAQDGNSSGANGKSQSAFSLEKKKEAKPFSRPEIFSKPKDLQVLFQAFREGVVVGEILRPRLQAESVENGRGTGILRNFAFRKFKEETKAVVYMNVPQSKGGGAFEPPDRRLNAGEQIRVTYNATVEGGDRPIYFLAKGFFLRKSFFVPDNPENPGKPWHGSREDAKNKFSTDVMVRGDEVIEFELGDGSPHSFLGHSVAQT